MNLAALDGADPDSMTADQRFATFALGVFARNYQHRAPLENLHAGRLSVDFERDLDAVTAPSRETP